MPDQKIIDYIKAQLEAGVDINKIKSDLMMQGSLPSEINLAFDSLNNVPPSPVAPSPVPVNNPAPVYSPSVNPAPVFTEQTVKSSVFKKVLVTIAVLILLGAISAGAYFGFNYYQKSQMTAGEAVVNTLEALLSGQIASGEIAFSLESVMEDVGQNYSAVDISPQQRQILSQLKDVAFSLNYIGMIQKNEAGQMESAGGITASVKNPTGGSLYIFGPQEFDLQYKTFSDSIYVNTKQLPAVVSLLVPSFDATQYLNQ